MEQDPAAHLPVNIQQILRRKSSRDPNSRFVNKLHTLLSFVSSNPALEDDIGLTWMNDHQFKMNKRIVGQIMGIKVNTLNVNLRDLKFISKQRDRDGWTVWEREGFTKSELIPTTLDLKHAGADKIVKTIPIGPIASMMPYQIPPNYNVSLGQCTSSEKEKFHQNAYEDWSKMFPQVTIPGSVTSAEFIDKCAQYYKQEEQPPSNARQVIEAIIAPTQKNSHMGIHDLERLLAMFGPKETIMMKIAHLLTCSNESGQWLQFDHSAGPPANGIIGMFDDAQPNCLVLNYQKATHLTRRIYNLPTETANHAYLKDENGLVYSQWSEYFAQHPVLAQSY